MITIDLAPASQATRYERIVKQLDYLDEHTLFEPAWQALLTTMPQGTRIFSISIEDKRITVEAAAGAGKLDRWTVRRARYFGFFERDLVSGPQPVGTPPAEFHAALFDLDDVALDGLQGLIDRAIQRAGLEDAARVTRIDIGAPQIVLPSIHFGPLRITLTVSSGRESAKIFATPDGAIVAADLSQTNRAERLDLLASDDWPMREAQEALTTLAGPDAVIRTIELGRKNVTLRQDNRTNPAAADFLSWDLSGARRDPIPTLNPAGDGIDYLPFALSEVDFTKLPLIKKNAVTAFNEAGAIITDITAKKTLSPAGYAASEVIWHVKAQFPNTPASSFGAPWPDADQLGEAQVRSDGTVLRVRLPKRLRPPVDWLSGEGLVLALTQLRDSFGSNVRIQEISMSDSGGLIYLEDPAAPGTSVGLVLHDDGLKRGIASGSSMTSLDHAFELSELDKIGMDAIKEVVHEAYQRVGVADRTYYRTTLYGSAGRASPAGTPQLEVQVVGGNDPVTYRFATREYVSVLEQF